MPLAGLEPARGEPLDFESSASANSATSAFVMNNNKNYIIKEFSCQYISL